VENIQATIIGIFTLYSSVGQCHFQLTSNLNLSQQWKIFKKLYYRNVNNLSLCRPVILSGNAQSEHVEAGEMVQTKILSEHYHFKPL